MTLSTVACPISAVAFAPFGELIVPSPDASRRDHSARLENRRRDAKVYLSTATIQPSALPLRLSLFERHLHSSQTFLAPGAHRYLVIVAPDAPDGGPDLAAVAAFVVPGACGITYRAGVWHHPMTVLDGPAVFSILMWADGTAGDEELRPLSVAIDVTA